MKLNRSVAIHASEIGSGKYGLIVLLIDSETQNQYDEVGQINCTVNSENRGISSYNSFKGEAEFYIFHGNGPLRNYVSFNIHLFLGSFCQEDGSQTI